MISNGCARVATEDEEHVLLPGQGFILNQNVMHSIHSIDNDPCVYYSLVFHPDLIFGHTNSSMRTNFLLSMQSFSILKTMLIDKENTWHKSMLDLLDKILSVNLTKSFGYELIIKGYLCQFWASLLNRLPQADIPQAPNISLNEHRVKLQMTPFEYLMKYRIFEASKQILNDRENHHSMADLALTVGFNSISYLSRFFSSLLLSYC